MTDQEFAVFAKRLFVSFPTLHEWLRGTLDPAATQAIWRDTLRPYRLDECLLVLDDWNSGTLKPFEAYERDKVHLMIRSMVGLRRDRERKRQECIERADDVRGKYQQLPNTPYTDASMAAAYKRLAPLYAKMMDGEFPPDEYGRIHDEEFAKL